MFPFSLYFSDPPVRWSEHQLWANVGASYCADEAPLLQQLLELYQSSTAAETAQAEQWSEQAQDSSQPAFFPWGLSARFSFSRTGTIAIAALAEQLLQIEYQPAREQILKQSLQPDSGSGDNPNNPLLAATTTWQLAQKHHFLPPHSQPGEIIAALLQHSDRSAITAAIGDALTELDSRFRLAGSVEHGLAASAGQRICFNITAGNAVTDKQAKANFSTCLKAIETVAREQPGEHSVSINPGALHPGFSGNASPELADELYERLLHLLVIARSVNVPVTIDASRSGQSDTLLTVIQRLISSAECRGWQGLGLTVQAYSKQALPTLAWLNYLCQQQQSGLRIRLVKGAYWNDEISAARKQGLPDYPVFTLKQSTDIAYQVCADYLLSQHCPALLPQFASHDPLTLARIAIRAGKSDKAPELLQLFGLNNRLFQTIREQYPHLKQRVCAAVGESPTLLSSLFRERFNGDALTHLISQSATPDIPTPRSLIAPELQLQQLGILRNSALPRPDSRYHDFATAPCIAALDSAPQRQGFLSRLEPFDQQQWSAAPLVNGEAVTSAAATECHSPYNFDQLSGSVFSSTAELIRDAFSIAQSALPEWRQSALEQRIRIVEGFAGKLQDHAAELTALMIRESGHTLRAAIAELRATINACYYYCHRAGQQLGRSPVSDRQQVRYQGFGVFVCISSADSSLTLLSTQIIAALLGGNTVLVKPDSHAPLIAFRAVELLLDAGLPAAVISLLPGSSDDIGAALTGDFRLAGIAFSGSVRTANHIVRQRLQDPHAPLTPFVATTRCQRIALTDTTLSAAQITEQAIRSAFTATGAPVQILYLPEALLDAVESMLASRLGQLRIATPDNADGDLGPLTDRQALQAFHGHLELYREQGLLRYERENKEQDYQGCYALPALVRLQRLEQFNDDCTGPVLHLIGYSSDTPERVLDDLNRCDTPLSLTIHSADAALIEQLSTRVQSANLIINNPADQIVPFDCLGLAAAGPKAGSPDYLMGFVREVSCSLR